MLSFLLIVNPLQFHDAYHLNCGGCPVVLLVIVVQLVELHRNAQIDLHQCGAIIEKNSLEYCKKTFSHCSRDGIALHAGKDVIFC